MRTANQLRHYLHRFHLCPISRGQYSSIDHLTIDENPGIGCINSRCHRFGLGHHHGAVAGMVSDLHRHTNLIIATDQTRYQLNGADGIPISFTQSYGIEHTPIGKDPTITLFFDHRNGLLFG